MQAPPRGEIHARICKRARAIAIDIFERERAEPDALRLRRNRRPRCRFVGPKIVPVVVGCLERLRAALDKVRYDGWLIAEMESRYRFAPDQQFWDTAAAIDRFIAARF